LIPLLKNPITIWVHWFFKTLILQIKNRKNSLKIGYLASLTNCSFGIYNTIYDRCTLFNVNLDNFSYVAANTNISRTRIGKFCSIGPNCQIGLGKHPSNQFVSTHPLFYSTHKQAQITISDQDYFQEFENIEIGNDVWVGANVIILDGVKIGDGAIVAAGSVVTKEVLPYSIVGGVPAQVIKSRFSESQIDSLLNIKWWERDMVWIKNNYFMFHDIDCFIAMFSSSDYICQNK
jgi:acetyltransferase-like isoleucine patch superfamily enzyme